MNLVNIYTIYQIKINIYIVIIIFNVFLSKFLLLTIKMGSLLHLIVHGMLIKSHIFLPCIMFYDYN